MILKQISLFNHFFVGKFHFLAWIQILIVSLSFGQGDLDNARTKMADFMAQMTSNMRSGQNIDTIFIKLDSVKQVINDDQSEEFSRYIIQLNEIKSEGLYYKGEIDNSNKLLDKTMHLARTEMHPSIGNLCLQRVLNAMQVGEPLNVDSLFGYWKNKFETCPDCLSHLNFYQGSSHLYNNHNVKGIKSYQKTLEVIHANQLDNKELSYKCYLNIAASSFEIGNFEEALEANENAYVVAEQMGDSSRMNSALINKASNLEYLGLYSQASEMYYQLLEEAEDDGNEYQEYVIIENLGAIYSRQENVKKAREMYLQAIYLADNSKHGAFKIENSIRMKPRLSLINTYFDTDKDEGLRLCYELMEMAHSYKDSIMLGKACNSAAILYEKMGNYSKSEEYYKMSNSFFQNTDAKKLLGSSLYSYGHFKLKRGETKKAGEMCLKALKMAEEMGEFELKVKCYECTSKYYKLSGNMSKAYDHLVIYHALKDSSQSGANKNALISAELGYKYEKKEIVAQNEIANLNVQNNLKTVKLSNQKYAILLTTALFLAAIAAGLFWRFKLKMNQEKQKLSHEKNKILQRYYAESEAKNKMLEAELKSKLLMLGDNANRSEKLVEAVNKMAIESQDRRVIDTILRSNQSKQILDELEEQYLGLHEEFVQNLSSHYPHLTQGNIKLCILVKMNLSNKEIAQLRYSSVESVKVSKSRLRKKLGIFDPLVKLGAFLNALENKGVSTIVKSEL